MKMPFSNNIPNLPLPSMTGVNPFSGHLGGVAPQAPAQAIRRDFSFVPQFLPALSIVGGLKQPPRG